MSEWRVLKAVLRIVNSKKLLQGIMMVVKAMLRIVSSKKLPPGFPASLLSRRFGNGRGSTRVTSSMKKIVNYKIEDLL